VLIDSRVLIEFEKGTRTQLLEQLLPSPHRLLINPIICSEYVYHLLGVLGGRSPLAIKEAKRIDQVLASHQTTAFLNAFEVTQIRAEACSSAIGLMKKHHMLPNDALILACCLWESIPVLVSHDSDFVSACQSEGIILVQEVGRLSRLL
jgi:uncharacterized protein